MITLLVYYKQCQKYIPKISIIFNQTLKIINDYPSKITRPIKRLSKKLAFH